MRHAVEIPVPSTWRQLAPPATEYAVGDGVIATVSVVQGLPEDPPEWLKVEIARRANGRAVTGPVIEQVTTETGWPAITGRATVGDETILIVMFQFLELGAVATVHGPTQPFVAHETAVREVLMRAQIRWGAPPPTLADLLDGSIRSA